MSFIVDATRRQHQESVPQEAAGVAIERVRRRERRIWLAVGTLTASGVILTLAIIIKWFVLPAIPFNSTGTEVTAQARSAAGSEDETMERIPAMDVGDDTTWYQPVDPAVNEEGSVPLAELRTPVRLQDAPADVQDTLLSFQYSSHLYTETPALRSLSVNSKRMREGELEGEWVLAEITERGAVWDNGSIMVDVPVLDLWN